MVVGAPRRLARAAYWCREFCCYASRQGARPQLFAGDAQQLAASTACIGSELVACLRGHKKCRKKLLASVL